MKGRIRVSPRAFLYFAIFLVSFGTLVALDKGSGLVSRVWLPLFWGLVALVSLGIYVRMWKARSSPDEIKKIKAQSLYGVLPPKFRDWLFP